MLRQNKLIEARFGLSFINKKIIRSLIYCTEEKFFTTAKITQTVKRRQSKFRT
jgi:hypothetical protein